MRTSLPSCVALAFLVGGCTARIADPPSSNAPAPPLQPAAPAGSATAVPSSVPPETCNGLDDDGDGAIDQGGVCMRVCSPSALAKLADETELPTAQTQTVPSSSSETPQLTAITQVPPECLTPGDLVMQTHEAVIVPCGARVDVDAVGLKTGRVVVQPGGVLRLVQDTSIVVDHDFLLCPGGIVEGAKPTRKGAPAESGSGLTLRAERVLLMGAVVTHASYTDVSTSDVRASGGHFSLTTERLLMAGLVDTAGDDPPAGFRRGDGGFVSIIATKESFFSRSSKVVSGDAYVNVPVL